MKHALCVVALVGLRFASRLAPSQEFEISDWDAAKLLHEHYLDSTKDRHGPSLS
jgi:hypothetical protein